MSDKQIEKLIELIDSLVTSPNFTWKEKRDRVLECASHGSQTNLREFATWFEEGP